MSLQTTLIDRLWNTEYGDCLEIVEKPDPKKPMNIRTIDDQVVDIQITQQLEEGLYHLVEYVPTMKPTPNSLPQYRFTSPFHLGFVLSRLSTLIENGKVERTHRNVKVDQHNLTARQKQLLEEIFKYPVFDGSWNVFLNASTSEVKHIEPSIADFNKCFRPTEIGKPSNDEVEDVEIPDVYLVLKHKGRYTTYNLSELYITNVIELEDIRELVDSIIEDRLAVNDYKQYNYDRNMVTVTRKEQQQSAKAAGQKMRHTNLVNHVASILSEHNPRFRVKGFGEDYINYHVGEETGEFPYLAQYIQPLWRLSVPGLSNVIGCSMDKDEAFRSLESSFFLESKIKPLSEDDIHSLQHYRFQRNDNDVVEHGRFTYAVKRDKR